MRVHGHRQCVLGKQMTSKCEYWNSAQWKACFLPLAFSILARECLSSWLSSQNERNRSLAFVSGM